MRWLYHIILTLVFIVGLTLQSNAEVYSIQPIGHVIKTAGKVTLDILPQYKDALLGLKDFSHIYVFYWFNRNDSPEKRSILKVHPRGNKENPLNRSFCYPFAVSAKSHRVVNMQNQIHRRWNDHNRRYRRV